MKLFFKHFFAKQLRYSPLFYKRLKAIQRLEKLGNEEIEVRQEQKFLSLFRKAYQKSSFYRSIYKKYGIRLNDIKSIHDLTKLPIIEKSDIFDHHDRLFIGHQWNKFTARSSGTSGASLTVYRDYQSVVEEGAYQWAHRIKFGHCPGMKTIVLRGNLKFQEKEQYDPFTKTLYLSSFRLSFENAEWYYQRIKDFAPNAIFAYPSSLESLANFFIQVGKKLSIPIIFTSSETLYSYQREKIEKVFSSRIIDWYGNAERTIALKEEQDGLYNQVPLYSVNEFEQDHIITTSLINSSFPLIRYKVDDIVHLDETAKTSSGRRVKEIQGRSDDVLLLPDGTRIGLICNAFDGVDNILLSQVVQESLYKIIFCLVVNEAYAQEDEELLRKQIEESIGSTTPYKIKYVDESDIIKSANDKFKLVINNMRKNTPQTTPELTQA